MSEHLRPEWLQIPIEDHEVDLVIGETVEKFRTDNTAVWLYPDRYRAFNHIVRWGEGQEDDGTTERWFGPYQEDVDALHEAGITMVHPPYPQLGVIMGFWAIEMWYYDKELEGVETTGEIPEAHGDAA